METTARTKSFRKDLLLIGALSILLIGAMLTLWAIDGDKSIVGDMASRFYTGLIR